MSLQGVLVLPIDTANQGKSVASNIITWNGNPNTYQEVCAVGDPSTGLGVSITAAGLSGTNVLTVQGSPSGVAIPVVGQGWSYMAITANGLTLIKPAAGELGGVYNMDVNPQNFAITVYDNAQGAASGQVLVNVTALDPGVPVPPPSVGVNTTLGLTINCGAAPSGPGLIVLYR